MRAIKIDVIKREVYEVNLPNTNIEHIYRELECDCFTFATKLSTKDFLYVDDEGLLRPDPIGAFSVRGYPQILSGHGLVIGVNGAGASIDAHIDLEQIKDLVNFHSTSTLPEPSFKIRVL